MLPQGVNGGKAPRPCGLPRGTTRPPIWGRRETVETAARDIAARESRATASSRPPQTNAISRVAAWKCCGPGLRVRLLSHRELRRRRRLLEEALSEGRLSAQAVAPRPAPREFKTKDWKFCRISFNSLGRCWRSQRRGRKPPGRFLRGWAAACLRGRCRRLRGGFYGPRRGLHLPASFPTHPLPQRAARGGRWKR